MLIIATNLNKNAGSGLSEEYEQIYDRFPVTPDEDLAEVQNEFVNDLVARDVWDKLELLVIIDCDDADNARENWIQSSYQLIAQNTPTFTPNSGASTLTGGYYRTQFIPGGSTKYQANDASYGFFFLGDGSGGQGYMGNSSRNLLNASNLSALLSEVNAATFDSNMPPVGTANLIHAVSLSRNNSANHEVYVDGELRNTVTRASTTVGTLEFLIMAFENGGVFEQSTGNVTKAAWIGGAFDQSEIHEAISLFFFKRGIRLNTSGDLQYFG